MENVTLFAKPDLGSALEATTKKVADRLQAWDPEALLAAPEADVIEELIGEGTVRCPELLRADAWMPPPSETKQMWQGFDGPVERRIPRLILVVPYEGERTVLLLRAGRSSWGPPRILKLNDHELHIAVEDPGTDAVAVRVKFEAQLDKIEPASYDPRHAGRDRVPDPAPVGRGHLRRTDQTAHAAPSAPPHLGGTAVQARAGNGGGRLSRCPHGSTRLP